MAKPERLTDDDLLALANNELRQAVGYDGGRLSEQRRKAMIYFLGEPKLDLAPPEIEGRSTVVSTDVRNTIMSMKPPLMAKFVGGDQVVEFEPAQKDDEQKATQCTDYLNYLFMKKCNGHAITSAWIDDALLQKNGIIKVWWDTRAEEKREEYKGLTDVELAEILDDEEVEVIDQKTYPDEEDAEERAKAVEQMNAQLQQAVAGAQGNPQHMIMAQQMQARIAEIEAMPPKMLYDCAFKRTQKGGKLAIANVPPEEFLISREGKTIPTARMVGHRMPRTLSELRSMGYKNVDRIGSDDAAASLNAERIERLSYDDDMAYLAVDNAGDDSQRVVWLNELYIRCDYDGDGIAELRKVVIAGNELLDNEVVDCAPFISITPVPMPHKFFGLSVADLAMEAQKTKTNILRAQLDNMYLEVNGRYWAVEDKVNLDDLLTSRPGGVVRVKDAQAVGRLDQGKGNLAESSHMMEWLEVDLEQRTGWTRYSQGNDSKALNQTATGVQIITNKGDMRVDLIARNFAEGFVDLFRMMLKLVAQHQDKKLQVRVSGEWIDLDPREWRNQFDVNVNVGLGIGSKDEQVQKLMALSQSQGHAMAIGVATPKHVYNLQSDIAKAMGQKNPDKYFNDPEKNPPPPRPDPKQAEMQGQMQLEQMKLQAGAQGKQVELQSQAQIEQMKAQFAAQQAEAERNYNAQLEQAKMQLQAEVDINRQRAEAEQKQLEIQQQAQLEQMKAQFESEKHAIETNAKLQIAQLQSATAIEVATIGANAKAHDTGVKAATTMGTAELSAETTREAAKEAAKVKVPEKQEPKPEPKEDVRAAIEPLVKKVEELIEHVNAPRTVVRDKDGRPTHVQHGEKVRPINRDENGRVTGY